MSGLKADASASDAYLSKALGGLDEVYIGYPVTATTALIADDVLLHSLLDNTTPGSYGEGLRTLTGDWRENAAGGTLGVAATAAVHMVAIHAKISTDVLVLTIDGTPYDLSGNGYFASANINQLDEFRLGAMFAPHNPDDVAEFIGTVTIGTTGPGSSDILSDDFSTDLSAWDSTTGDVSIISSSPGPAPSWTIETYTHENVNGGALVNTIAPENLHFVLNLAQVGGVDTVDFEISLHALDAATEDPLVSEDFIEPYQHDFLLKRNDLDDPIIAGIITEVAGQDDSNTPIDFMTVSGKQWLHYLEGRIWPYDADLSQVLWTGPPGPDATGLYYNLIPDTEIGEIVQGILETIRDLSANFPALPDDMPNYRGVWLSGASYVVDDCVSDNGQIWKAVNNNTGDEPPSANWVAIFPSFSLPFSTDIESTGVTTNYQISNLDTTSIFEMIQTLSQAGLGTGGFDFLITWDKVFKMIVPEIGDPDLPIFEIDVDVTSHLANALSVGYTNEGPAWTHFLGTASASAGAEGAINKHFRASSAAFRRWDGSSSFGGVKDLDLLESMTSLQLAFGGNPVHTIPISVKPAEIDGFWLSTRPGQYINVVYDLGFHTINSIQKIVSMDCTVDAEGEETVILGFNQFYDASDDAGLDDI